MTDEILFLLKQINSVGYDAFIVGGFTRDALFYLDNTDIDIVTNAPFDILLNVFKTYKPKLFKNNTIKFKYKKYSVDIAQIRQEIYDGYKTKVLFSNDLNDDYKRRDFTFNSIYLNKDLVFYDFDNSIQDCLNKRLKFIGNPTLKCEEDPTRIIRALYFILKYNISLYDDLNKINFDRINFSKCNINLLNKALYKVLKLGKNKEFVTLLKEYNIYNSLFSKELPNFNLEPKTFLKDFGYRYFNTI